MNGNRNLIHKKYAKIHEQPHKSRFNATKKKGHGSKRSKEEIEAYVELMREIKEKSEEIA